MSGNNTRVYIAAPRSTWNRTPFNWCMC